ncbi:MAG: inverse autotransporter beta domain-containing protein [Planctomycetaceae bacterium]|nr:inverse autotransporter beta domain-containing protein [Planctomycetaceae bacterium]
MFTRHTITLALLSLLAATTASAQTYTVDTASGEASGSVYGAAAPLAGLDGGYLWLQGDFGERPGAPGNYFSTGVLAPIQLLGPDQAFLVDSQIWVTEGRLLGGNVGLNQRWLCNDLSSIFGVNAFITWDHSQHDTPLRQFSVGGEWLTEYLQVTGNFYLPWSEDARAFGPEIRTNDCLFTGRGLVFQNMQRAEVQLKGADVEAGTCIPGFECLSVYGGAYWLDANMGESVTGVSGRVALDLTSVQLGVTVYDDDYFGTSVNANGTLLIGAGAPSITCRSKCLYDHLYDRTRRRTRIGVQETLLTRQEQAINPATNRPWEIITVDNTAANGGNGTFETPYNNLQNASNSTADIIFIRTGTTSEANPLAGGSGLILTDNQLVLGEGTPFAIQAANRPANLLCTLSSTGPSPFVTADAGANVFNLANNNRIVGVNIISPDGGTMIAGNGVNNFLIENINQDIVGTTGNGGGIFLQNATGNGVIDGFAYNNPTKAPNGGIAIWNSNTSPLDLSVSDATIVGGIAGIDLRGSNADINAMLNDVHAQGNGYGARFRGTNGGEVVANIANSDLEDAMNHNLDVIANTGGRVVVNGDTLGMNGAMRDAIHADVDAGEAVITLADTTALNTGESILDGTVDNFGLLDVGFTRLTATGAGSDAIALALDNFSTGDVAIADSDFSAAMGDGIHGDLTNNSALSMFVTDTPFSGAGQDGLDIVADGNSAFEGVFINGSFANAMGGHGASVVLSGGSMGNLTLDNTDANDAVLNGLNLVANSGSTFNANLLNGVSLDDAGQNAINGIVGAFSTGTITGTGVSGNSADADGMHYEVNNGSLNVVMNDTGSFADAMGDGLQVANTNGGVANITFQNGGIVNFSGADANGLLSTAGNGATTNLSFANGANFDGAGIDAIHIGANTLATTTFNGTSVSGANAMQDGIELEARTGGTVNMNITDAGSFTAAGRDGLRFTGLTGGTLNMNIAAIDPMSPAQFDGATEHAIHGSLVDSTGTLNLTNVNANGGTLGGLLVSSDGMSTFTGMLNNVTFDNASMGDAIEINARNGAVSTVTGTGVSGAMAGADAIHLMAVNGSTNNLTLSNVGSFTTPVGDGLDFQATGGSTMNIALDATGLPKALFDNAGGSGIMGEVTNSTGSLMITNADFSNATVDGMALALSNANTFNTTLNTVMLDGAMGGDAMRVIANSGTVSNLTATDVTGTGARDDGLDVIADNSVVAVSFTNVAVDGAMTGNALRLNSLNGSNVTFNGDTVSGANAGNDAIHLESLGGSTNTFMLTNAGSFTTPGGDGLDFLATGGSDIQIDISGPVGGAKALFDMAQAGSGIVGGVANSTGHLNITNADFSNAAIDGMALTLDNANTFDTVLTDVMLDNAMGGDAMRILASNSTDTMLTAERVSGTMAMADGLDVISDNSIVDVIFNEVNLDGTMTGNGLRLNSLNGSAVTFNGDNVSAANAGNDAIHLESLAASTNVFNLVNGGSFAMAGGDGLDFTSGSGSTLDMSITMPLGAVTDFSDATGSGIVGSVFDGAATLRIDDANFNGAGVDGMAVVANNSTFDATLNRVTFDGDAMMTGDALRLNAHNNSTVNFNGDAISGANAGNDAMHLEALGGSTNNFTLTNAGSFTSPGGDGIDFLAQNGSTLNIGITPALGGLLLNGAGGSGVTGVATDSTVTLNLENANVSNATVDGLAVNASNSTVTANLTDVSFDGTGTGDAIRIVSTNNSTTTFNGDNVSGANAGNDGIHLEAHGNSVNDFNLANAGSFTSPNGDGIEFIGTTGGDVQIDLTPGAAPFILFDGAGGTGILGTLTDATGTLNLQNAIFDNAMVDGLAVTASNSTFTANLTDVHFNNAMGGDAIRLDSSLASMVNFTGVNLRGNMAANDGIRVNAVSGSNVTVDLTGQLLFADMGADAIDLSANNSTLNFNLDASPTGAFYRAGANAVNIALDNMAIATIDINNINAVNADNNGINLIANNSEFHGSSTNSDFRRTLPGTMENGFNAILMGNDTTSNWVNIDGLVRSRFNNALGTTPPVTGLTLTD